MKKVIGILIAMVLLLLAVTVASAGQTSEQLVNAGWFCVNDGPSNWMHCFPPTVEIPGDIEDGDLATIQVKVFDVPGTTFLGTELLIHKDLYNNAPCAQDGGGLYDPVGAYYMACHHFWTGHHAP